jgi:hypothetical protein
VVAERDEPRFFPISAMAQATSLLPNHAPIPRSQSTLNI